MFEGAADDEAPEGRAAALPPGLPTAKLLAQVDAQSLSVAELLDVVTALQRHSSWIAAVQTAVLAALWTVEEAERVAEFASGQRRPEGSTDDCERHWISEEVGLITRIAGPNAQSRMQHAFQLMTRLPETVAMLAAGDLHPAQAMQLSEAAIGLTDVQCAQLQNRVLLRAPGQSISEFRRSLRRAVAKVAPVDAERAHAHAVSDRRVDIRPADDGMATLVALLPAPEAMRIKMILDDAAEAAKRADQRSHREPEPDAGSRCISESPLQRAQRRADQCRADTLVELIEQGAACHAGEHSIRGGQAAADLATDDRPPYPVPGDTESSAPNADGSTDADDTLGAATPIRSRPSECQSCRSHRRSRRSGPAVQVRVDLTTLLGLNDDPGELAGYGPIPASLARAIAADPTGTWRRLVTDPVGRPVDYGRTRYRPPKDLDDFVRARDPYCVFPNCHRRAVNCELDHIRPRCAGGATNAENLAPLCARHHHLRHEGRWKYRRASDSGAYLWTSSVGNRYLSPRSD